jgi:hypothetical protein
MNHVYGFGYAYAIFVLFLLIWVGINLYLSNQVLIKYDQLKLIIAVSQLAFPYFWPCMSYNLLHLLSTNHKCTHACFIKTNAAQNKIIDRSSLKTSRSFRLMSPSHMPVKMKFCC